MKRNEEFVLHELSGSSVLVPVGSNAVDFNGLVKINDTAKFLWEKCIGDFSEGSLIAELKSEYGIDDSTAAEAVNIFIKQMSEAGCIE